MATSIQCCNCQSVLRLQQSDYEEKIRDQVVHIRCRKCRTKLRVDGRVDSSRLTPHATQPAETATDSTLTVPPQVPPPPPRVRKGSIPAAAVPVPPPRPGVPPVVPPPKFARTRPLFTPPAVKRFIPEEPTMVGLPTGLDAIRALAASPPAEAWFDGFDDMNPSSEKEPPALPPAATKTTPPPELESASESASSISAAVLAYIDAVHTTQVEVSGEVPSTAIVVAKDVDRGSEPPPISRSVRRVIRRNHVTSTSAWRRRAPWVVAALALLSAGSVAAVRSYFLPFDSGADAGTPRAGDLASAVALASYQQPAAPVEAAAARADHAPATSDSAAPREGAPVAAEPKPANAASRATAATPRPAAPVGTLRPVIATTPQGAVQRSPTRHAPTRPTASYSTVSVAQNEVPAAPVPSPQTAPAEPTPADNETEPSEVVAAEPVVKRPFDKAAAAASLVAATGQAASCRRPGDPVGTARVIVTFAPSGRVTTATVSGAPFAGTSTGGCIASRLRSAMVPAFSGDYVTVTKSIVIQ